MPHYWIENSISGADLGTWTGENETEALAAMHWAAGYQDESRPIPSDLTIRCLEEDDDALAEFIQARTGLDPEDEDDGAGYRAVLDAVQSGMVSPSDEGMDSLISDFRWWRAESGRIYATPACIVEPDARLLTLRWTGSMAGQAVIEFDDAELDDPYPDEDF